MSLFSRVTQPSTTPSGGGGLFGTPAAAPATTAPSGGLFGTAPTQPTTTTGTTTSLFGTPAPTKPGTGTGLFGTPAPAATSAPQQGGLFGTAPTTTTAPSGGGLFGTPAPAAPATGGVLFGTTPAAGATGGGGGGGLFGNPAGGAGPAATSTTTTTTTTTTSAPQGGGLFSTAPAAGAQGAAATMAAGGGLFGGAAPKPGLFGNSTTQPQTQQTKSLFGTQQQQQVQQQQQQQPPNVQQAVKIEWGNLAPYHKFHELSDIVRNDVEMAERHILSEIQKSEALAAMFPEHREMVQSVSVDAELMERRLFTTNSFLDSDAAALNTLSKQQKLDDQHASLSVRTLDLIRLPHAARMLQAQQAAGVMGASGYGMGQYGQQSQAQIAQLQGQTQAQNQAQAQGLQSSQALPSQLNPLGAPGASFPGGAAGASSSFAAFAPLPTVSSTTTSEIDITTNAGMINYFNRHAVDMEARLKLFLESVAEVEASLRSVEMQAAEAAASAATGQGGIAVAAGMVKDVMDLTGGVGGRQDARRLNSTLRGFYDALNDVSGRVVEAKEGLRELRQLTGAGRRG